MAHNYSLIEHLARSGCELAMKRLTNFLLAVVVLTLVLGAAALAVSAVRFFFTYVSTVPKETGAALIAGAATILVATLTVTIGRYFERKRELDALYRDKKTEIYDEFLKEFFHLFFAEGVKTEGQAEKDLVAFLREFMRKQILWSGPEVIKAFIAWKDHSSKGIPDAQSLFLAESFILAIRKDLRHSNSGVPKGFFAKLFLREGSLFLSMAAKNPNVTLAELAAVEELLKAKRASDGLKGSLPPPNH